MYSVTCLWCGARLIQAIQALRKWHPPTEIAARCARVAADWSAHGHDEKTLRELAARKETAIEPDPGRGARSGSAAPSQTKRP